jgi:hypothetical protein
MRSSPTFDADWVDSLRVSFRGRRRIGRNCDVLRIARHRPGCLVRFGGPAYSKPDSRVSRLRLASWAKGTQSSGSTFSLRCYLPSRHEPPFHISSCAPTPPSGLLASSAVTSEMKHDEGRRIAKNVKAEINDELREEYDLKRLRVRRLGPGRKSFGDVVRFEPDVAEAFPNADSVNEALRSLIRVSKDRAPNVHGAS